MKAKIARKRSTDAPLLHRSIFCLALLALAASVLDIILQTCRLKIFFPRTGSLIGNIYVSSTPKKEARVVEQYNVPLFSSEDNHDANDTSFDAVVAGGHAVDNSYHLQSEVESITHVPIEAKIIVRFKTDKERKCKKPRILGRLSGKYLSMIYWDADAVSKMDSDGLPQDFETKTSFNHTKNVDVITGYYHLPAKGRYFVDIIGLYCNDFPFDYDFNEACLENVDHNRLAVSGAYVDVLTASQNFQNLTIFNSSLATNAAAEVSGYWKWSSATVEPVPLMTRYQRQNCRRTPNKDVCMETAGVERFEPYTFEWLDKSQQSDLKNYAFRVKNGTGNETFQLCTAGNSHALYLRDHFLTWIDEFNMTNIEAKVVKMSYPRQMMSRIGNAQSCNAVIVGFGQWSAAGRKMPATTFPNYYNEYKGGIDSWLKRKINVVIRKTHYNPLGDEKNTCPPTDWRTPSVIDTYNEIARRIAKECNVPFLDAGYVMDPMWDSAHDFCHFGKPAGKMEALYFLRKIIDMEL